MTGLLTPCGGIPGIASIVLGIVALRQIRRRPQPGAKLAVGGLVAAGVWLVVLALGTVVAGAVLVIGSDSTPVAAGTPSRAAPSPTPAQEPAPTEAPTETGPQGASEAELISVFELEVGYCIEDLWAEDFGVALPIVACDELHDGQVYALFDLPDGDWPGAQSVEDDAIDSCYDILADDFPRAMQDDWLDFYAFYPSRFTWQDGDREVVCFTIYLDDQRTGTVFDDDDYPQSPSGSSGGSGT